MFEILTKAFVYALEAYAGLGFVVAVPFVWFGVQRLDSEAQGSGVGFRLQIRRGYGNGLKSYRRLVYAHIAPSKLQTKLHNYFSPEEIAAIQMKVRSTLTCLHTGASTCLRIFRRYGAAGGNVHAPFMDWPRSAYRSASIPRSARRWPLWPAPLEPAAVASAAVRKHPPPTPAVFLPRSRPARCSRKAVVANRRRGFRRCVPGRHRRDGPLMARATRQLDGGRLHCLR